MRRDPFTLCFSIGALLLAAWLLLAGLGEATAILLRPLGLQFAWLLP